MTREFLGAYFPEGLGELPRNPKSRFLPDWTSALEKHVLARDCDLSGVDVKSGATIAVGYNQEE